MELILPKHATRTIWRALREFSMLGPGDHCLVGFSGGKDSTFLLYALAVLQQKAPFAFSLGAATIDPMFTEDFPLERMRAFADALKVPLFVEQSNLAEVAFRGKENPCARCAYFRRGALNRIALREGYNKLALAHHLDDAVETFLMNMTYTGRLLALPPVSRQDRVALTVIRPLIYLRERQIAALSEYYSWQPVSACCPLEDSSARAKTKAMLGKLEKDNPAAFSNLVTAMRLSNHDVRLWPPLADREMMRKKYREVLLPENDRSL